MKATNFRAWVAQPNTPESDKQEQVKHIVNYEVEGQTVSTEIMATDPLDAISWVQQDVKERCQACGDTLNKEAINLNRDICFECYAS